MRNAAIIYSEKTKSGSTNTQPNVRKYTIFYHVNFGKTASYQSQDEKKEKSLQSPITVLTFGQKSVAILAVH